MIKTNNCQCPETTRLQGVLANTLASPEQAEIVAHLDSCVGCQAKLEQLATGDSKLLESASAARVVETPTSDSAYWPALASVERDIRAPGLGGLVTTEQPILTETRVRPKELDFLEPSIDDTKYLGALDRFQLETMVGRGGMGMVFRAFDACLQRTVAVKVLDPQTAKTRSARERFCREGRAAARIAHENVVSIHYIGEVEDRDIYYLVMQFVEGRSLQEILDKQGPLPVKEAVRIAAATASGLAAAHATNLIHRDIKPGNILIQKNSGRVLLTDFGLARFNEDEHPSDQSREKLTQTGYSPGTPLYMSPEQARGEPLTHQTDLFSLGGVLYAMLTGKPPFQGSTAFAVLEQVTRTEHLPIQQRNPEVSHSLAGIIDKLLAKNPKDRFSDATTVAHVLQAELEALTLSKGKTSVVTPRYKPNGPRTWWARRSPVVLAGVLGLFGLGVVAEASKLTQYTVLGQRGQVRGPLVHDATPTEYTITGSDGAVWAVAFNRAGTMLATASESGTVRFWDAKTGTSIGELTTTKYRSPVWSAVFNADGTTLATASDDGYVRMWDVETKQEMCDGIKHLFPVRCVAMSPDGKKLASGTRNGMVTIWDAQTGQLLHQTQGHEGGNVMSIAFSPDGKIVASAGTDNFVKLWNVADGSLKTTLRGHQGPVYAVAIDPHSKLVASAGWDHTVRVWNIDGANAKSVFDQHTGDVWSLAFCPAGQHVITAGQDQTAKWINVDSGKVVMTYHGHAGPLHAVTVSADGKLIASGGRDGTVRVWRAKY